MSIWHDLFSHTSSMILALNYTWKQNLPIIYSVTVLLSMQEIFHCFSKTEIPRILFPEQSLIFWWESTSPHSPHLPTLPTAPLHPTTPPASSHSPMLAPPSFNFHGLDEGSTPPPGLGEWPRGNQSKHHILWPVTGSEISMWPKSESLGNCGSY